MKIGDAVKCICETSTNYKRIGEVVHVSSDYLEVRYDDGELGKGKIKYYVITCNPINKVVSKIMGIKETFLRGLMSEPQKTFRKAGITNGDNLLTQEGTEVFLNWLFQKNSDAFKTEVADVIVTEQQEEKK